jgi:hypothetical protein
MGLLITFIPRPREEAPPRPPGPAQILLFTGVRYERGDPPRTGTTASPSRRIRRRRG